MQVRENLQVINRTIDYEIRPGVVTDASDHSLQRQRQDERKERRRGGREGRREEKGKGGRKIMYNMYFYNTYILNYILQNSI